MLNPIYNQNIIFLLNFSLFIKNFIFNLFIQHIEYNNIYNIN